MDPAFERPWTLYVLRCRDGTYYTGITNDLERRLKQHQRGRASRFTRSRLPVILVHQEGCVSRSEALKKEWSFKRLKREEKEEYLHEHGSARDGVLP